MSWNNNGNNGSRDPWGGKDGPPDIDEALKKNSLLFKPRIIKKGNPNQKIKVRLRYFGIKEWHEGILPFSVKLQFENNVAVINFENSEIRGSIYSSVKICT